MRNVSVNLGRVGSVLSSGDYKLDFFFGNDTEVGNIKMVLTILTSHRENLVEHYNQFYRRQTNYFDFTKLLKKLHHIIFLFFGSASMTTREPHIYTIFKILLP